MYYLQPQVALMILSLLALLSASGCRVEQVVQSGGIVVSDSGTPNCPGGETCIVEVEPESVYSETFTAIADEGFGFVGWGQGLCRDKLEPCALMNIPAVFTALDVGLTLEARFERREIAAGGGVACAIWGDAVHCWGDELWGQTDVPELQNPRAIMVDTYNACAVDDTGVVCWGAGQRVASPPPPSLTDITSLTSAGHANHFCAISDNQVHCWGSNDTGQLNVPTLQNPRYVGAGSYHACALHDGGVTCWGSEIYLDEGQADPPALSNPTAVSVGGTHSCALDDSGVVCWGDNQYGQIDVPPLDNPIKVSAGQLHTCALDDDGVHCWGALVRPGGGWSNTGQAEVPDLRGEPTDVFAGYLTSCALLAGGWTCWGQPSGSGLASVPLVPSGCFLHDGSVECDGGLYTGSVPKDIGEVQELAESASQFCVANASGLKCWEHSPNYGGSFPNTGQSAPPDDLGVVTELFGNFLNSCAFTDSGVRCWQNTPEFIANLIEPVAIASSWGHPVDACAIDANGLSCSGIGINNTPNVRDPLAVAISASSNGKAYTSHACALHQDGVSCWGVNEAGQTDVPALNNPRKIGAGFNHSCALTDDGVICWGGIQQPRVLDQPYDLAVGEFLACALDRSGVVCWDGSGNPTQVPGELRE
jgi:hypothetical protein